MRARWVLVALVAAVALTLPAAAASAAGRTVDVTQAPYGAVGNGTTNDRGAIQAALDAVAADGGGTVVIPSGRTFLTGSLRIGSGTTVQLDGTLLQSQNTAHYSPAVERGHDRPVPRAQWDHMWLANQPFLFSTGTRDVTIQGDGTLQMTRDPSEDLTIHVSPIGFYRVDGYVIRDIAVRDAMGYNLALFTTRNGLVEGLTIDVGPVGHGSSDGISLQNSQHVRITGNYVKSSDDGIYVWSSYRDPRGTSWWSSEQPQPSKEIEIDHNTVEVFPACCKAVALIAWGANAPDLNQVAISDVSIHDNRLRAPAAVGCWCDDVYTAATGDHAPIARVSVVGNDYLGDPLSSFVSARITDLTTDFGMRSTTLKNSSFELHGPAWWSAVGGPVVEQRPDGDWAARIEGATGRRTAIYQGVSLANLQAGAPVPQFRLQAEVAVRGAPLRLFVRDTCSNTLLAEQWVDGARRHPVALTFAGSNCGNVQIGLDNGAGGSATGTGLLYGLSLAADSSAILATDPVVRTTGSWLTFSAPGDLGGNHMFNYPPGEPATLTVPFHGTRARLLASVDTNLGEADILIDGVRAGHVSFLSPTRADGQQVFDSGDLPAGDHVLKMVPTSGIAVFNALLVTDRVPVLTPGPAPTVSGAVSARERVATVPAVAGATATVELFGADAELISRHPVAAATGTAAITLPDQNGTYVVRTRYRIGAVEAVSAERTVVLARRVAPRPRPRRGHGYPRHGGRR